MVSHDVDLFEEYDKGLSEFYKENKLLNENNTSTRNYIDVVEICECVPHGITLKDQSETTTSRSCPPGGYILVCYHIEVFIPCIGGDGKDNSDDGDPNGDDSVGTGGGQFDPTDSSYDPTNPNGTCVGCSAIGNNSSGGGVTSTPSFIESILMLQNCVFGDVADIDTDGTVTGINDANDNEFCESWSYYKERCLDDEFAGVQLLTLPLNSTPNYMSNPYYIWGQFASENPSLLGEIMNTEFGCITSDQLDLAQDVSDAFNDFTNSEKRTLKKSAMDNGIWSEDAAMDILISQLNINISSDENQYIKDNFTLYKDLKQIINDNNADQYGISSAEIYTKLATLGLLDATYTFEELEALEVILDGIINGTLQQNDLSDRLAISSAAWFKIFQTEANANGGDPIAWMKAQVTALKEGFLQVFKPLVDAHITTLQLGAAQLGIPAVPEEWQALMAVFGPMLLELGVDIGTDFIPIVGEAKAFAKCGLALNAGNYGDALFEFIGGVAGIIPIGDLIKGAGKVVIAGGTIFTAFKAVKSLAKVSSNIFTKLIEYAQQGWKIAWDDGLKKMIFKNGDEVVGEIDEFGIPNIKSNYFKSIIDVNAIKNLFSKELVNGPNPNIITKEFVEANGNRFNITDGPLKSELDDIILNGDPSGTKTEYLMNELFKDADFTLHDGSYGPIDAFGTGKHGFDGVYIKGSLDNPTEIIINESKSFNANNPNSISLSKQTATNPAQMTNAWVDKVIVELENEGKFEVADALKKARDPNHPSILTKIVSVIDATPTSNSGPLVGGVNIVKVVDQ
jgi:hypothetical protein